MDTEISQVEGRTVYLIECCENMNMTFVLKIYKISIWTGDEPTRLFEPPAQQNTNQRRVFLIQ